MSKAGVSFHQAIQVIARNIIHFLLQIADAAFHLNDVLLGGKKLLINGVVAVNILILGEIAYIFVLG